MPGVINWKKGPCLKKIFKPFAKAPSKGRELL